jgi:hypothetical protein
MEYPNVQLFPGCTPERALGTSPDRISRRHVTPPRFKALLLLAWLYVSKRMPPEE